MNHIHGIRFISIRKAHTMQRFSLFITLIFICSIGNCQNAHLEQMVDSLKKYEERRDTLHMARICHMLSQEYWMTLRKNEQAEQYANRALELLTLANIKNVTTCNILENLARLYYRMGLELRALDAYEMALDIKMSQDMIISNTEFLTFYEFYVECFRLLYIQDPQKHEDEMAKIETMCNAIMEESMDNKTVVKQAKTLLAKLYMYFHRFDDAEKQYQEILTLDENLWGKNSYSYIVTLQDLAYCYSIKGDIKTARDMYVECINYNPTKGNYNNVLTHSIMLKDFNMIQQCLPKTYNISLDYLKSNLLFMSSWQREDLLRDGYGLFELISPAFLFPHNEEFAKYAYNTTLISKGLQLNTEKSIKSSVLETQDSRLMTKHKELILIQEQIQTSKDSAEFISLNHKLELKEKELLSLLKEKNDFTGEVDLTWHDVQKELGDNDIAIEFVYNDSIVTVPTGDNSTAYYGALVLRKDWTAPKVIQLSQMMETDALINEITTTFDDEKDYRDVL